MPGLAIGAGVAGVGALVGAAAVGAGMVRAWVLGTVTLIKKKKKKRKKELEELVEELGCCAIQISLTVRPIHTGSVETVTTHNFTLNEMLDAADL